jgi:hypothetical protein
MAESRNNQTTLKDTFRRLDFNNAIMTFDDEVYQVESLEIDQENGKWLGPHSSIIRLRLDKDIERYYHDYIGDRGWNTNIVVSVQMLAGEPSIELKDGYITSCVGKEVILVVDLMPVHEAIKANLDQLLEKTEYNFGDIVVSEKERHKRIKDAEKKNPHLQRFRIAMEED